MIIVNFEHVNYCLAVRFVFVMDRVEQIIQNIS